MTRLAGLLLLVLVGCATPHPPHPEPPSYVCVPANTSLGQAVIYCQPHVEKP